MDQRLMDYVSVEVEARCAQSGSIGFLSIFAYGFAYYVWIFLFILRCLLKTWVEYLLFEQNRRPLDIAKFCACYFFH